MNESKAYVKDHNIIPTISFKDGKAHVLKIIQDKRRTIQTDQGDKEGVSYKVMEGETLKRFFTSSDALIVKLADIEEGESVKIQMKSRKTQDGFINFYEVEKVLPEIQTGKPVQEEKTSIPEEEIPIIEDEEREPEEEKLFPPGNVEF